MANVNKAALLTAAKASPMEVKEFPYPTIDESEVIVKVKALALNPMDWMIQAMGNDLFNWLKYPYIGGTDVAGDIVQVGSKVKDFKVGDRVVGLSCGFPNNSAREGAFQHYAVMLPHMISQIPSGLEYKDAAVLPLGVSTAACALYQKEFLALPPPTVNPKSTGEAVLIWGGASSVGTSAIQLAVASGYEVVTTASPKNFDYCKKIGATKVFDYNSPSVKEDLVAALSGKKIAGAFAVTRGSDESCVEVVSKSQGNKFVASTMPAPEGVPEDVKVATVFGGTLKDNEVSGVIFKDFLPEALAKDKYLCLPQAEVVGHGLESIQPAFGTLMQGVSCKKLVVTL